MIPRSIDIFCEIIDNYGDIGVVYRLSKELKRVYPQVRIRIILNKLEELLKVNPKTKDKDYQ
ncbi:MAG: elongation factor P maturation arginine rhamnosyltransferase EarP, partial [Fusobacterium sp.]